MHTAGREVNRAVVSGVIMTLSGRRIPVPPCIRTETNRKAVNDLKKHDEWLIQQAKEEAVSRGDEYNLVWINQMRPGRLSPADKACANIYLFGEECVEWTSQ